MLTCTLTRLPFYLVHMATLTPVLPFPPLPSASPTLCNLLGVNPPLPERGLCGQKEEARLNGSGGCAGDWSPSPLLVALSASLEFRARLLIEDGCAQAPPERGPLADSAWSSERARGPGTPSSATGWCLESGSLHMHVLFQAANAPRSLP